MWRGLLTAMLALFGAATFAAVDVNQADQATLETIKGIGPALSEQILDARSKGPFKDWSDLRARVKGLGPGNAARLSAQGLTVGGAPYQAAPPASAASR